MKSRTALLVLVGLAVVAGLFVLLRPPVEEELPRPGVFELWIADGRLASGTDVIRVRQGDVVTVQVTSDRNDELHVHGYDLHARLSADTPAPLRFTADRSGRFAIELHKAQVEVGVLEVLPR
jgi:hypothetical protein